MRRLREFVGWWLVVDLRWTRRLLLAGQKMILHYHSVAWRECYVETVPEATARRQLLERVSESPVNQQSAIHE
jgi:hypothetical protein